MTTTDDEGAGEDRANEERGASGTSTVERAVMGLSVLFTVALFAFAAWQAVTAPEAAAPTVTVTDSQLADDGGVIYEVVLRNPGRTGVVSATVSVGCSEPPTELVFRNLPAGGSQRASVRCPPGTTDPEVIVVSWVRQ